MKNSTTIFLLLLIAIGLKAQDSCSAELVTSIDKFDNKKTVSTSIIDAAIMYKIIEGKKNYYYLSLTSYGETASVHRKGVYVLFSDKTKFTKLNEIVDCKVNEYGSSKYVYSAFVPLTVAEVSLFAKRTITDIKLYIYENEIGERNARELICGTKQLLKINK